MKIILKETIAKLGDAGDLLEVSRGYAMNYLIPSGYAITATKSAIKERDEVLRQRAHKEQKLKEDAEQLAAKMDGVKIVLGAKASSSGKIFGSVNTIQIAEALEGKGFSVDRKQISIDAEPIKELGEYTAKVRLHREVSASINFEVVSE